MNEFLNRRSALKWAAALPILGTFAADAFWEKARAAVGKKPAGNIYSRLGVRPCINARGTWTYLSGSLELPEVRDLVGSIEPQSFTHAWNHPDEAMDALYRAASERVEAGARAKADPAETFSALWALAGLSRAPLWERRPSVQLTESWFCCAEPSRDQFVALRASAENRK